MRGGTNPHTRPTSNKADKMKERLRYTIKKYSIILSVGVIYLVWVLITDLRIPCPLFSLTGYQCPGCGVTRMISHIARLNFKTAFDYNPYLFVTALPILSIIFIGEYRYVRYGKREMGLERYFILPLLIGALIFGVLRNIQL